MKLWSYGSSGKLVPSVDSKDMKGATLKILPSNLSSVFDKNLPSTILSGSVGPAFPKTDVVKEVLSPWKRMQPPIINTAPLTYYCPLSELKAARKILFDDNGKKYITNPFIEAGYKSSLPRSGQIWGNDFVRSETSIIREDFRPCWFYDEKWLPDVGPARLVIVDDEPIPGTTEEEIQNGIGEYKSAEEKITSVLGTALDDAMKKEIAQKLSEKAKEIKLKILEDRLKNQTTKSKDSKEAAVEAINSIYAVSKILNPP